MFRIITKEKRLLFVCNKGGHYSEMLALKALFKEYDSVLLTNEDNMVADLSVKCIKMWFPKNNSRIGILLGFFQCFLVWLWVRPRVIITTGAGLAVPIFVWGKLFGSRLIFIESRARIYSKSLAGKFLAPLCDKVIVQWSEMLNVYKKAEYWGTLI
jgi:UDP-N-acetylglucosamine:LPS N-acetylglucosamine transferase